MMVSDGDMRLVLLIILVILITMHMLVDHD